MPSAAPGNPPVVLDRNYDLESAAKMTVMAVGSDNGILCENVDYIHRINVSKLAMPLEVDLPSAEELFED